MTGALTSNQGAPTVTDGRAGTHDRRERRTGSRSTPGKGRPNPRELTTNYSADSAKQSQMRSHLILAKLSQRVALRRWCHDRTDAPYERGRLVVTPLGAGQFTFEVVAREGPGTSVPAFAHVGK